MINKFAKSWRQLREQRHENNMGLVECIAGAILFIGMIFLTMLIVSLIK